MIQTGGFEEVVIIIVFLIGMLICCGFTFRGKPTPIRVTRTRPREKVDGLFGATTTDYSYTDGKGGALPVGFATTPEREKPETYEIHKTRHDEAKKKETES